MKVFRRLSRMTQAVLISGLIHILILTFLFWPRPDDDEYSELQLVDMSSNSLEMDVAPPEPAPDEAAPSEETDLPLPAAPPAPPRQNSDAANHSTLSMADPAAPRPDMTPPDIPQRDITQPVLIKKVNPRYPTKILKDVPSFELTLMIQVMPDGVPGYVAIQKTSGIKELDEAAVTAAKQWKFSSAFDRTQGRAVPYFLSYDLKYPIPDDQEQNRPPVAP